MYLEDQTGRVKPVTTEDLVGSLRLLANPPLRVFLAACESARRRRSDAFVPMGPTLVERGHVWAAVAMSEQVGLATASMFTRQFYESLHRHGITDLAMNEARAFVQDQWDWEVPVLFSRLQDNQLFDFPVGAIQAELLSHLERAFVGANEALGIAGRIRRPSIARWSESWRS